MTPAGGSAVADIIRISHAVVIVLEHALGGLRIAGTDTGVYAVVLVDIESVHKRARTEFISVPGIIDALCLGEMHACILVVGYEHHLVAPFTQIRA